MSKAGEIPYTWEQIEMQIKEAISCQASILETFGPWCEGRLVADYLGLSEEQFRDAFVEDVTEFDIRRHQLYDIVRRAYDYAYQLDGARTDMASEWQDVDGLLQGFPQTDAAGQPSPFCTLNDFPLRRMLETFFARFGLFDSDRQELIDYRPTIRELALLANMTVPAVRTSLSKEGFKLDKVQASSRGNREEASFRLNTEDARLWLSRRRGFIPQSAGDGLEGRQPLIDQLLADRAVAFPDVLARILDLKTMDAQQVARENSIDEEWLSGLIAGEAVNLDLEALRQLARALDVSEAEFVSIGVRHLLRAQS
ncbi:hypothetical protein [Sedimentimonas flavescens]|uniref:hypothetical protein n=1 Tax=Sedimentimonas flavescens TaxID=2851012 RepID=UPI0021A3C8E3|nr:hypothetical protein [Sedimentimonas flavescens]MCT2539973.1 hypothetical protein [Sedimentimonas flavescens]